MLNQPRGRRCPHCQQPMKKSPFSWYLASWHPPCVDAIWIQKSCFKREMQIGKPCYIHRFSDILDVKNSFLRPLKCIYATSFQGSLNYRFEKPVMQPSGKEGGTWPTWSSAGGLASHVAKSPSRTHWSRWRPSHVASLEPQKPFWHFRFWVAVCKGEAAHRQRTGHILIYVYVGKFGNIYIYLHIYNYIYCKYIFHSSYMYHEIYLYTTGSCDWPLTSFNHYPLRAGHHFLNCVLPKFSMNCLHTGLSNVFRNPALPQTHGNSHTQFGKRIGHGWAVRLHVTARVSLLSLDLGIAKQ